ncbi:hypothetical protein J520_2230 [Acinetobacter sp. 869535]|nr:hypothetical protein J520_2230 [Acinetobacter sp. 869535]
MQVHCHIGSLEKIKRTGTAGDTVHCHIGSLEKLQSTGGRW